MLVIKYQEQKEKNNLYTLIITANKMYANTVQGSQTSQVYSSFHLGFMMSTMVQTRIHLQSFIEKCSQQLGIRISRFCNIQT